MDWTPSRIQRYEPPPTLTYAEKRKVREDAKLEQAKQEARVMKEIEALERKLRQVQLEKTKRSSGSSTTTTRRSIRGGGGRNHFHHHHPRRCNRRRRHLFSLFASFV